MLKQAWHILHSFALSLHTGMACPCTVGRATPAAPPVPHRFLFWGWAAVYAMLPTLARHREGTPPPPINGVDNASPLRPLPPCRGQPRQYDCLIQRFSLWSGFMAPVGRHSHTTAGAGDCRAAVSGYHPLLLSSRCALPLPSREDVQHEGERQPLVVAGAGMDMCQLSRLPWAPQVRIHRRGTPPGMEDNHTPRQGF